MDIQQFPGIWLDGRYIRFVSGGDGTGGDAGAGAGAGGDGGAAGGGDGGGDEGDGGDSGDDGAAGDGAAGGKQRSGGSGTNKDQIVFSDSRALGRRLGQEREKTLLQTAQAAGFDTTAAFQEHLKATKEKREKDQGEVTTLRQKLTDAEGKLAEATTRTQKLALRHAVEIEATKLGFTDPEDAFGLANFAEITFDDDGTPDRKAITAKLNDLSKAKTYLLTDEAKAKAAAGGGSNNQSRSGVGAGAGAGSNPPRNGTQQSGGRLGSQITDERRKDLAKRFPFAGFDKPER